MDRNTLQIIKECVENSIFTIDVNGHEDGEEYTLDVIDADEFVAALNAVLGFVPDPNEGFLKCSDVL